MVFTWYVNDWTGVEVLREKLCIQGGTHQYNAQVWPLSHDILQNQQQEVTEENKQKNI